MQLARHIPSIGIILFALISFYSSTLYPGGSQADLNSLGYDWYNNYWCNLMGTNSMNGQVNPARPWAIFSMCILCSSMIVFFYKFANNITEPKAWKRIIKVTGVLSMISAMLIFTEYHDLMTSISSFFGSFVAIGIMRDIVMTSCSGSKIIGLFCISLLILNNYIYYSTHYIAFLPILQKLTFIVILGWIILLNSKINRLEQIF